MPVHKVKLGSPIFDLGKSDVKFSVKKDKEKIGQLHISNGAVVWFPSGRQYGYKVSWEKLAGLFKEFGRAKAEKK